MIWNVVVAKPAQKGLAEFPAKDRDKIVSALASMATDPFAGDVLKLEGEQNRFRRRVGSYRIFFTMEQASKSVYVSAIVRRTTTTY